MMKPTTLLLSSVLLAAHAPAASVGLSSTWSEFDYNQSNAVAPTAGILALSAQSSSGFTAEIGANTLDVDGTSGIDQPGRPRVYQTFAPQTLAALGDKVSLSFNMKLGTLFSLQGDTQFRFGLADTLHNQAVLGMVDIGAPDGTTMRLRPDLSLTGNNSTLAPYVAGDWSDFGNTGSATGAVSPSFQKGDSYGSASGAPNGIGLQDVTTTHHFTMNLERISGGIQWSVLWGNDGGAGTVSVSTNPFVVNDSALPMNSIDGLGFVYIQNAPYGTGSGSTTISNVVVDGVAVVPEPSSLGLLGLGALMGLGRRRARA